MSLKPSKNSGSLPFCVGDKDKKTGGAAGGVPARPQRKGAHWGMGGARTAGGGRRDRTRLYPLAKNQHKMEENHLFSFPLKTGMI
jgi:hypothetical protein